MIKKQYLEYKYEINNINILDNLKMIKNKDWVWYVLKIKQNILDNGRTINKMDMENYFFQMDKYNKVNLVKIN